MQMKPARLARVAALSLLGLPVLALAAKNPADYQLKVQVVRQMWGVHNVRYAQYKATGSGNIIDGSAIHAFDFKYDCSVGLARTPQNQSYLAKWKKTGSRLELLIPVIGKEGKYQTCELETSLHYGVYVYRQGGVAEISQEEAAKARQNRR
jgi:hypothetical protein